MDIREKIVLVLLRLGLGWIFAFSGGSKVLSGQFDASFYLQGAQNLGPFYAWFADPANIGWVNALNEWGQLLIGISLISGIAIRISGVFGILLMLLYYLPVMKSPYVDQHVIYILVFLVLMAFDAGRYFGLKKIFQKFVPVRFHNIL